MENGGRNFPEKANMMSNESECKRNQKGNRHTEKDTREYTKSGAAMIYLRRPRVHPICHIYFPHICLWVNDVFQ